MNEHAWGGTPETPEKASGPKPNIEIFKEPSYVETVQNRIYFYSEIYRSEILQLNRRLRETGNELKIAAEIQRRAPANIFLHINSFGGSIFAGLSAMDEIVSCEVPVITIVDGCCASAATFLSVVGKERIIRPNAFMLIHQLSSVSWGKYRELQDDHVNHTKLMDTIKSIYAKYTKIPADKIDEILDHDLWFDAKTCIEYGLVDRIE
jgi:ATP-dependent protease ClpP protease subunit